MKALLIAIAFLASATLHAQTYEAAYVAGRDGLKAFPRGGLVLEASAVLVTKGDQNWKGTWIQKPAFTIPLATIVSAVATTEHETHVGLLSATEGVEQDYVTITTETAEQTEALVFKVPKKQGAGIAAKITFAIKRATPTQPLPIP